MNPSIHPQVISTSSLPPPGSRSRGEAGQTILEFLICLALGGLLGVLGLLLLRNVGTHLAGCSLAGLLGAYP